MKQKLALIAFIFSVCSAAAQNVTLTKGETIQYLDKKVKECVGHKLNYVLNQPEELKWEIAESLVVPDPKGIAIKTRYKAGNTNIWKVYTFNPAHIKSVLYYSNPTNGSINEIKIELIGKTCVKTEGSSVVIGYSQTSMESSDYAQMLYLRADPESFEKTKKALLYLQSLLKAEDDPFK